jgi:hypothetical protein
MIEFNVVFKRLVVLFVCIFVSMAGTVSAGDTKEITIDNQAMNPAAPPEIMHFGRLVGKWKITDWGFDQQGKRADGAGANWNFYWVLGGTAIQDDWISPGFDKPVPEKGRQYGTNIRIYNPKTKMWEMAWMSNSGGKVDTFKAAGSKENMVMKGFYNGGDTIITFYNISKNHFSWKMEKQDAKSKQWKVVYRIEADRVM